MLDDGRVILRVAISGSQVVTEVLTGGKLSNNKGINKQGGGLAAAPTDKDYKDMNVVAEIDADFVAISFPGCRGHAFGTGNSAMWLSC